MNTPCDPLVPIIEKAASIEASRLTRSLRQSPSETPEFAAQVRAAVIEALNRGLPASINVEAAIIQTARSASTDIYRRHTAKIRDIHKKVSIESPVGSEGQTLADTLAECPEEESSGNRTYPSDLRMDVDAMLQALPDRLRGICIRLQSETVLEIARSMNRHPKTIYGQIERARSILEKQGFRKFPTCPPQIPDGLRRKKERDSPAA